MNPCTANNSEFAEKAMAPHQFSATYEQRKRALIAEVARGEHTARAPYGAQSQRHRHRAQSPNAARNLSWKIAAAVAAMCVALPMGAYAAANHEQLFGELLGTSARTSTPAQTYTYDKGDGVEHTATIPSHEYVDADLNSAEALLGSCMLPESQTIQAGSRTITVNAAVRSENAMLVAYTLEDDSSAPTLYWDERTNATKGARFQENAQLRWDYRTSAQLAKPNSVSATVEGELSTEPGSTVPALAADAEAASELPPADKANDAAKAAADLGDVPIGSFIYVDPQRSTKGVLYCYEYLVFPDGIPEGESLAMVIGWSDGALSDVSQASQTQTVDLSGLPVVPATTFTSDSGAQLSLSPLGLTLNMSNGLGLDDSAAKDPGSIAAITLKLANGETYTVFDSAQNMENTMYAMGSGTNFGMNFNRLVDPADVKAVEVSVKDGATVTLS